MLTEKSSSEDGTGNFASVLRDQGKEVQKTEGVCGTGKKPCIHCSCYKGSTVAVKLNESKELFTPLVA